MDKQQVADKMDWEGWPDVLEHIAADEIDDPELSILWEGAREIYTDLNIKREAIDELLEDYQP